MEASHSSHFKVCFHLEAEYGERWGEGAARYFSIEADFLDEARVLMWKLFKSLASQNSHR